MLKIAGLLAAVLASSAASAAPRYDVEWKAAEFPVASVKAHLHSTQCIFRTSDHWADFFEGKAGWSRFVSGMQAFDDAGQPLPSVYRPDGTWLVGSGGACDVELRYRIDFAFGRKQWEAGNEQVAYTNDRAIYTTGLPLFVIGDDGRVDVDIHVPDGWVISTPWQARSGNSGHGYSVPSQDSLLSNTLVVGRHAAGHFHAGNLQVTSALVGDMAEGAPVLTDAFRKVVPDYVELFGDQEPGNYMFAVIPGPEDGESFTDSFAVATTEVPTQANKIIWANHLAHELLHYWMGGKLAPVDDDRPHLEWFLEGFTEYLANNTLVRTGVYSDQQYRERIGRHLGTYMMTRSNPNFMKITPLLSGEHKWGNRPIVYSGGVAIAFCLDATIHRDSHGARGLRDMMRLLYSQRASSAHLTLASIEAAASTVAGTDQSGFFKDYVEGTKTLAIDQCGREFGMEVHAQNEDVFIERVGAKAVDR